MSSKAKLVSANTTGMRGFLINNHPAKEPNMSYPDPYKRGNYAASRRCKPNGLNGEILPLMTKHEMAYPLGKERSIVLL